MSFAIFWRLMAAQPATGKVPELRSPVITTWEASSIRLTTSSPSLVECSSIAQNPDLGRALHASAFSFLVFSFFFPSKPCPVTQGGQGAEASGHCYSRGYCCAFSSLIVQNYIVLEGSSTAGRWLCER
ncbi:hypothetical protein BDV28DRAFT_64882 [Aspergillus coremiiformis]|uniref:Uncharacterized protein n=1 Tax=Aspergillus coremiiformis TaxID=138285 RepID=A0A5N6ZH78_9EURO|nr:hypothetical protein BDV28DRAFT_64882 [Aspergillus coremiiformis]